MLRFSLLVAVTVLAAGVTGCTHCDTCDDFPVPCVGHNTGVPPVAPAESYTMNVGPSQTTIVSNPAASVTAPTASAAPAPATGPGPFKPLSSSVAAPFGLDPLPRGDITPPPPPSLGSAKAN